MAYQGFGYGIAEDGAVIGKFVAAGLDFFVSTSFSKSFSLYGERVGALSVLCENKEEAARVLSQLKIAIRTNYSNPPIHGGAVVATVLGTPELRALWEKELGEMRVRIKADAPEAGRRPQGRRREGRHELHHHADRHVQLLGPDQGPDGAPARTSSASTAPTPAACAWPRSTARTSTTSARASPR